jgi:hypothetical protein
MDNTQLLELSLTAPTSGNFQGVTTYDFPLTEISGRRAVRRQASKPNAGLPYEAVIAHQATRENPEGSERSTYRLNTPYVNPSTGKESVAVFQATIVYPNGDFPVPKSAILRNGLASLVSMENPSECQLSTLAAGLATGQI